MKICFIMGEGHRFLGGVSLYLNNLILQLPKNHKIFWVYRGDNNQKYKKNNVNYIEIKVPQIYLFKDIVFNLKVNNFLKGQKFDVINSHAIWGYWINSYKKKKNQIIVHTYHGSTYHYFKTQLRRFSLIKKVLYSPILLFAYFIEKPPMKKADNIICVSDHVKEELMELHGKREDVSVIRTGVNLKRFKPRNKGKVREKLNLKKDLTYGLYIARGGYWNKGLDRVTKLSQEMYKLNKNYRLIVVGSNPKKVGKFIDNRFMILLPPQSREKLPYYYNSADFFFNASRYEGGAPTLVTSEAIASKCLVVCSKDSRQEILRDGKECLIFSENWKNDAKRILTILENKVKKDKIVENAFKKIKELSLERWGRKYLKILSKLEKS